MPGPESAAARLARRFAFVAGLAALLAAGLAWPILGKFGTKFRELGDPAALSPAAAFLLAQGGVWPTGILAAAGAVAFLSSFSRRSGFMLGAGFTSLVLTATAGAVIPVVLMNAVAGMVGAAGPVPQAGE